MVTKWLVVNQGLSVLRPCLWREVLHETWLVWHKRFTKRIPIGTQFTRLFPPQRFPAFLEFLKAVRSFRNSKSAFVSLNYPEMHFSSTCILLKMQIQLLRKEMIFHMVIRERGIKAFFICCGPSTNYYIKALYSVGKFPFQWLQLVYIFFMWRFIRVVHTFVSESA